MQLDESQRTFSLHSNPLHGLIAAGWAPLCAVAASGLTIGFFLWYALILPMQDATLSEAGLPLLLIIALAAAIWAWQAYSDYFASRTGIKFQRSLQYDAISWSAFVILWLSFLLPLWLTHGGIRLFFYCAALFCIAKLAVAARFNETVRDVTIDFIVTRFAIIVIAELAAVIIGQRAGTHVQESRTLLLAVWGRWDAVHYLDIAAGGAHEV